MCRSIKVLRKAEAGPTDQEIHEAALQFVRKISGYRTPSQKNAEPFDKAVLEVTASSRRLLESLTTSPTARPASAQSRAPRAPGRGRRPAA